MTNREAPPARRAFARRLRLLRSRSPYGTAREFAQEIGEKENTYTRWERAETEPNITQILRICQVLDIDPNELFLRSSKHSSND
jgi:transcriptional regulator with XRE-family HTH domain